jgi:1-acyl-sn-glycerol-3-phosphate acyltransferase
VLVQLLKFYARLAVRIYCRKIVINHPEMLKARGPLLLAANHPNSFLDGIILTTLFRENIYSLARGDAFRKPWHERLLRKIQLLPVYRTSEGVENLEHNYTTFESCHQVFSRGGIVLIFSEGRCMNEWKLRPLKKGTARLAISSWMKGIDLEVVPVGFNYNPFRNFGKNVFINFGRPLNKESIMEHHSDGKLLLAFNAQLKDQLEKLVYDIDPGNLELQEQMLTVPLPLLKKLVLLVPAAVGFLIHAPFYFLGKALTKIFFDNDHFDSALASMLMLAYPLYLIGVFIIMNMVAGWRMAVVAVLLSPFLAWAAVQVKKQV